LNINQTGNQLAEENARNTFNRRKFISVTLAFSMAVILLMAIGIMIANVSGIENLHTFTTTAHILSGVIMFGFVVPHIKLNWKAMKSYFTRKKMSTSTGEPNKQNGSQFAGTNAKSAIRCRRIISLVLILSSLVMLAAAYVIQLAEDSGIQSYMDITNSIHVLSALVFTGFLAAHLKMNWKTMKGYVTPKKAFMSKEVFYGLCISAIPIVLALALVLWNPVSH